MVHRAAGCRFLRLLFRGKLRGKETADAEPIPFSPTRSAAREAVSFYFFRGVERNLRALKFLDLEDI